jgi:pimeloyl-ACP methyl ester carboxylesterase
VRQPTLVLHYADDPAVPLVGGRQVAEGIPDARLRVLKGAYHLPPARDAARIAREVVAWCRTPATAT